MTPWYEYPADSSSRMMIPAYQNDLQMFPIFRMQFALLDDLCIPAIISCEKLDLRVNISGCASYGTKINVKSHSKLRRLLYDCLLYTSDAADE